MPAVAAAGLAGSPACDGTDPLFNVRRPGRVDGATGTVDGLEGRQATGAAPGGRGAAAPAPQAEAELGRPGGTRRPDPAAAPAAADLPCGDAGHAAALVPAAGPLALDLPSQGRTTAGRG